MFEEINMKINFDVGNSVNIINGQTSISQSIYVVFTIYRTNSVKTIKHKKTKTKKPNTLVFKST